MGNLLFNIAAEKNGYTKNITLTDLDEANFFSKRLQKKGYRVEPVQWAPVYTLEEGLKEIKYPAWLYKFARRVLPDLDDAFTAYCKLPLMTGDQVKKRLKRLIYSDGSCGSLSFKRTAKLAFEANLQIEDVLSKHKKPVICSSFGKDSLVVMDLVLQHDLSIPIIFNDTGIEHPQTYRFIQHVKQKWDLKNVITTSPDTTFWDITKKYGWPLKGRGKKDGPSEACAYHLKTKPTQDAFERYGWDLSFLGLYMNENGQRYKSGLTYGDYFYHKTFGVWRCYPIHKWDTEDIWDYTVFFGLPVNDIYRPLPASMDNDEAEELYRVWPWEPENIHWEDMNIVPRFVPGFTPRTGCMYCPIGAKYGKFKYLRLFYPQVFNDIIFNQGFGLYWLQLKAPKGGLFQPTQESVASNLLNSPDFFDYIK